MLGLGAKKGLHGVGLFMAQPSSVISKTPIRDLADFKGKKIRVFASKFQTTALQRLGATPVAMTLGDVLPALQQGAIDGAVAGLGPYVGMHFQDAAKYVVETNQPGIFVVLEISQKWYNSLPEDLRQIIDQDGRSEFSGYQSISAQNVWRPTQGVGGQRRGIDQPASRRTGDNDENPQ